MHSATMPTIQVQGDKRHGPVEDGSNGSGDNEQANSSQNELLGFNFRNLNTTIFNEQKKFFNSLSALTSESGEQDEEKQVARTNDKHEKKGRTSEEQKGSERKLELVGAITDLLNIRKAPAPDDYWSCHLCTYNNTLTATSCDVCGTARLTPATKNENSSTQNGGSAADVDTSSSRDLTKDTGTDDGADPEDEGDGVGIASESGTDAGGMDIDQISIEPIPSETGRRHSKKQRSVTHLAHFRASDSDINRPNVRYLFVCLFICFFFSK
ncbi:hypothetical protein RFI_38043 [Reticulomyxa filosa]|uniref:RanBP2-type domain-containing protein n=1 Tax=Reticulomyxa filosa TaxID=46433 RepID=X6LEA1_RETFI|nr:hypothetical protein RFI_38043 [Reticulomyxa filosa]|eukprot:ETN99431.1 hypothetical protein RFI_38043 [Reticulomyxa filosa]